MGGWQTLKLLFWGGLGVWYSGGSDGLGWYARSCPGWNEVVVVLVNSAIRDGPFCGA